MDLKRTKRSSGQRSKKRKFTGNMYTRKNKVETEICNESISAKKINLLNADMDDLIDGEFCGYRLIDIKLVFSAIQNALCCKICGHSVSINEKNLTGLCSKFTIDCSNCKEISSFKTSKMIGTKVNQPEINVRFTYAMKSIGKGHPSMKLFCGVMDLPQPVAVNSYNSMIKKLLVCAENVSTAFMKKAAVEEVELSESTDIVVSGDGTWKTRGHSSRIGVCTVIGDKSGKVIDYEVLSSFCKECDYWKNHKDSEHYVVWKSNHDKDCLNNHNGSAGKMEPDGMVEIFKRSKKEREVRYASYIGDGDTKTYQAIVDADPYKEELVVQKIECVGHIQKRMGCRLRKLKQSGKKLEDGKSIGGKGRLTDKVIDLITVYYGNAIRANKNSVSEMRKAIWATYFHTRSTNSEPLHSFCPTGSDSWCGYQKAIISGCPEKYIHKNLLPLVVMDAMKPIFNDLSHPKLLVRCIGGKTQNSNESINALVWKCCPKTSSCGKRIVKIAVGEAVILFNEGNVGRLELMKDLGLTISNATVKFMRMLDEKRIQIADVRHLENTKEKRQAKKRARISAQEKLLSKEGVSYEAGNF